jgi:hypothetical protein
VIKDSDELREAIRERDELIARVRGPSIDAHGDESLIPEMVDACNRVEELAQSGLVFHAMEGELAR